MEAITTTTNAILNSLCGVAEYGKSVSQSIMRFCAPLATGFQAVAMDGTTDALPSRHTERQERKICCCPYTCVLIGVQHEASDCWARRGTIQAERGTACFVPRYGFYGRCEDLRLRTLTARTVQGRKRTSLFRMRLRRLCKSEPYGQPCQLATPPISALGNVIGLSQLEFGRPEA